MKWRVPVAEPILSKTESAYLKQVMAEGRVTQGRFVAEFEKKIARSCGVKYAVALSSGTAAVHSALMALGIGKGDEVITTSLSCIASANPILFQGAKPVFTDIDPDTYNMDYEHTESLINRRTKAILAVHLFGQPLDMTRLMKIARKHKLAVIEDACQSLGAKHRGRAVGSFGDIGCFSFYANKIITTAEGGMAVTNSASLYRKIKGIRNLGQDDAHFVHPWIGANYKMSNLHGALGVAQMEKLERFIAKRRENARYFTSVFGGLSGIHRLSLENLGDRHVYFSYPLEFTTRQLKDKVLRALTAAGVETRPFFSVIPDQKSYRDIGYSVKNLPAVRSVFDKGLYVSCSPALSQIQKSIIINTIKKALK